MGKGFWLTVALLVVTLAGCGVDWFPEYKRLPTTPDPFSFTPVTGFALNSTAISNAITVKGLTAATTPIKVSGATGSAYAVNGGTPISSDGTVKNGDSVTVRHTSAATPGTTVTSTLTIGEAEQAVSADFSSTTAIFKPFVLHGGINQNISQSLVIAPGVYQISISSPGNTAVYSLYNEGNFTNLTNPVAAFTNPTTIFLRNSVAGTATITINGVSFTYITP